MNLLDWKFSKNGQVKAWFSVYPRSTVILHFVSGYYFTFMAVWSAFDPAPKRADLEEMERIINDELGCLEEYEIRRSAQKLEI
ncbi:hypothetical protein [Salisediminibacterium halotolerans]|uniref:Uncharacterized protein n=1 Tax=Salisediminibacterium halotolerans TaxID=517425 RepID=A0A1H9WAL8_9BACI|nr:MULTISPECIES: hypothetical protein [Salisediminibacterium]RLJ74429.1 hypothetical protein BCL39_1719 [Actinophytocola xinjiangensis]RPE87478.1 hypothetical protein EDD67_1212 [Salisediminibacterium halotolerans]TWG35265.1 hypothetical protein BCL52_1716 [Salisediminibacterium halotolerans]SES30864.1 hypothetical protein SAMN05444126_1313 [Salisediminibacterium haloalkalitolerans]GEL06746.1 hypothetical protein SHA02_01620 [Salisediminibacterium halotolerans]